MWYATQINILNKGILQYFVKVQIEWTNIDIHFFFTRKNHIDYEENLWTALLAHAFRPGGKTWPSKRHLSLVWGFLVIAAIWYCPKNDLSTLFLWWIGPTWKSRKYFRLRYSRNFDLLPPPANSPQHATESKCISASNECSLSVCACLFPCWILYALRSIINCRLFDCQAQLEIPNVIVSWSILHIFIEKKLL